VRGNLNLASQPFRNQTLATLGFYASAVLLVGVTVKHGLLVRQLLPDRTSAAHSEVRALEEEATRLRREAAGLRLPSPDSASLERWTEIKDLVDRRAFSWTRLLGRLEGLLPGGVRITSIIPNVKAGEVRLEIAAQAESTEAGLALLKRFRDLPEFQDAVPLTATETSSGEGAVQEFRYSMTYRPSSEPVQQGQAAGPAGDESASAEEEAAAPDDEAAAPEEEP
jgi:Tfp pilus assembly protein PilN